MENTEALPWTGAQKATEETKSKISNIEWGLLIGALFMIDGIQVVIEWLMSWWGIGVFINWFIDVMVGMSLAFYLQWRGQSIASPKRLAGLLGTFALELIPIIDELPLWGLDGIFNMVISKSDEILAKIPGGGNIQAGLNMATGKRSGSVKEATEQIKNMDQKIKDNRTQMGNTNRRLYSPEAPKGPEES